jgi:hypothetical protein
MRIWQIKHAEDPESTQNLVKATDQRDSYERTDNYNVFGVFVYFSLKIRQNFLLSGGCGPDETPLTSDVSFYSCPYSPDYLFELFQPLLVFAFQ